MIEYAELLGRENYSDISAVCLRKRNYACDRIFRYLGDTVTDEDLKKLKESLHNRDGKKVYIYSIDGNILGKFNSIQEASKAGFGNSASISGVLNNKEGYITVKGNFACSSPGDYKAKLQRYMKGKSPIQCYSLDGKHEKTFYKIADAVKYCNCTSRTSIRCCLNGTQYKAYNHLWRYSWDSSDLKI